MNEVTLLINASHSSLTIDPKVNMYSQEPVIECHKLKYISVYALVLFVTSLYFNITILYIFYKFKSLQTTLNMLIMSISVLNLAGTLIEFPILAITNYNCRYFNFFSNLEITFLGEFHS
jgi:hypothetical protein